MGRRALIATLGMAFLASGAVADAKIERLKSKPKDVPAGKQATQKLACPQGMHVLSGGAYTSGSSLEDEVAGSAPFDGRDRDKRPDDGWKGEINAGPEDETMRTYAICSNTLKAVYKDEELDYSPTGLVEGVSVGCAVDTTPIGGGIGVPGKDTQVVVGSDLPCDRVLGIVAEELAP